MDKRAVMENSRNPAGSKSSPSALKQMEQMMGRNYSDFMRSLAAKYNQNSAAKESIPNGDIFKPSNPTMPSPSPFGFMPGNPFQLAAAAAAAGLPVSLPNTSSAVKADNPFPFFRPPQNVMDQVTQTQQALLSMMRTAQQQAQQQLLQKDLKRPAPPQAAQILEAPRSGVAVPKKESDALDLSSGSPSPKRSRRKSSDNASSGADQASTVSMCNLVSPCSHEAKEAKNWSVEQVCRFVSTVEHCQPFVENFREQGIDGSTLILLKEDHLVTTMKMRLGSVLKFKAALAKKMGSCPICLHCVHCHNEMTNETKTIASSTTIDKNSDKESAETPTETLDLVEDSKKLNETSIDKEPSKN